MKTCTLIIRIDTLQSIWTNPRHKCFKLKSIVAQGAISDNRKLSVSHSQDQFCVYIENATSIRDLWEVYYVHATTIIASILIISHSSNQIWCNGKWIFEHALSWHMYLSHILDKDILQRIANIFIYIYIYIFIWLHNSID